MCWECGEQAGPAHICPPPPALPVRPGAARPAGHLGPADALLLLFVWVALSTLTSAVNAWCGDDKSCHTAGFVVILFIALSFLAWLLPVERQGAAAQPF